MLRWKIWYDDGTAYSDADGPPESAPCFGVLVIAQADHDVGRELLCRKHFYYWERDRWWPCGDLHAPGDGGFGLYDYLARPGWRKVVAGRNAEHSVFSAIFERARLDSELPVKSALLPGEARR